MPHKKSNSGTKNLLYQIAKAAAHGFTIMLEMKHYQRMYLNGGGHSQVIEFKKTKEQYELRNRLYQLKRSNYIRVKKDGDKLIISLTDKGQRSMLSYQICQAPPCKAGLSTLVIFDIPEQAARARRELRLFLHEVGFKQLQKSVWLHKNDVATLLQTFLTDHKIKEWVRVLRAEIL